MRVLLDPQGPFYNCDMREHRDRDHLEPKMTPAGWFPDVRLHHEKWGFPRPTAENCARSDSGFRALAGRTTRATSGSHLDMAGDGHKEGWGRGVHSGRDGRCAEIPRDQWRNAETFQAS
ncbi:hypothetical protein [Arthrobacter sp. ES1]|uniref:hypothetical protein n=1 Tax=Micrococcaceae TaxID=1268 RepID=UPI002867D94F|nr:hypothetical protein [Arthrobacter sp. ES1]